MAPAGDRSAQCAELSSGPVKQDSPPSLESPDWLNAYEHLAEAERLARLDVDRQLVAELRANNFTGVHWDYYAIELTKYGLAVLTGWSIRGLILDKVRRRGFGGLPAPRDDSLTDPVMAASVAGETVVNALIAFRKDVLIPGVWDPAKGASIKTFFIGQCLKQFANVYRAWHHETYGDASFNAVDAAEIPEAGFGHHEDVVVRVSTQHEIRRVLATIKDPRVKQAFVLSSAGHSHVEIARRLGVTDKAVERMMANERDRQRRENVA